MPIVFAVPFLDRREPIGSPQLTVHAHDGDRSVVFVVPRDLAMRHMATLDAQLPLVVNAWETSIEEACRRAYTSRGASALDPISVEENDFRAPPPRGRHP